jgi:GDPmannose 4,6-dehydratase
LKKYDRRDQLRTLCRGQTVVSVDPRYFRPTEVDTLLGDPSKARRKLGWEQKISFKQMVKEMVDNDLKDGMREALWKQKGFIVPESFEANM